MENQQYNENITPDLERIKTLIGKVLELANKGIDGEKQAAKKKLEKLLSKYGLTLADIDSEDNKLKRTFRIKNRDDYKTILTQVICDVAPSVKIQENTRKLEIYSKLNAEQYIEVKEKFDYFWNLWCKEKEQFTIAFIIKNSLGIKRGKSKSNIDEEMVDGVKDKMSGVTQGEYVSKNKKLIANKKLIN